MLSESVTDILTADERQEVITEIATRGRVELGGRQSIASMWRTLMFSTLMFSTLMFSTLMFSTLMWREQGCRMKLKAEVLPPSACAQMNLQGLSIYCSLTILVFGEFRADVHGIEHAKDDSLLTIFNCVLTHSL